MTYAFYCISEIGSDVVQAKVSCVGSFRIVELLYVLP